MFIAEMIGSQPEDIALHFISFKKKVHKIDIWCSTWIKLWATVFNMTVMLNFFLYLFTDFIFTINAKRSSNMF